MYSVSTWMILIIESLEDHIGVWDSTMMRQLSDLSLETGIQLEGMQRESC